MDIQKKLSAVKLGILLSVSLYISLFANSSLEAGRSYKFTATSFCKGSTTFSGLPVRRGIVAADPTILPLGSIVRISGTGKKEWDGVYSVQDTGPAIKGYILDIYFWSCYESLDFGRRPIEVDVLRDGWNPNEVVADNGLK